MTNCTKGEARTQSLTLIMPDQGQSQWVRRRGGEKTNTRWTEK